MKDDTLPPERRPIMLRLVAEDAAFVDALERFRLAIGGPGLPRTAAVRLLIYEALSARGYLGATAAAPAPAPAAPQAPAADGDKWGRWGGDD